MARLDALARLATGKAGAAAKLRKPPTLTGRELAGNGKARRVALTGVNLSWPVTDRYGEAAQQLLVVNAGDVVTVSEETAEAKAKRLVTESAYAELVAAYEGAQAVDSPVQQEPDEVDTVATTRPDAPARSTRRPRPAQKSEPQS